MAWQTFRGIFWRFHQISPSWIGNFSKCKKMQLDWFYNTSPKDWHFINPWMKKKRENSENWPFVPKGIVAIFVLFWARKFKHLKVIQREEFFDFCWKLFSAILMTGRLLKLTGTQLNTELAVISCTYYLVNKDTWTWII